MHDDLSGSIDVVRTETARALSSIDPTQLSALAELLAIPDRRWFCFGQGRSGLVARMIAMRMMHAGFDVHTIGESTSPAVRPDDAVLVLSASGETVGTLRVARGARELQADLAVITSREDSSIAACATRLVLVRTAETRQFGGSLFEQAALLTMYAVLLAVTGDDPAAQDTMQSRHANLE